MKRVVVDEAKIFRHRSIGVRILLAFFVFSTAAFINSTVNAQDSFAAVCSPSRYSCNSPETVARNTCDASPGASGAMWFNTSDNATTSDGYYSATVNVAATSNSVRVNLRGSVNACNDSGRYTVYAVRIAPQGANGWRLTGQAGSVLNRGNMSGSRYTWSSQGSSLGADLNVSGLAINNSGRIDSQSITIDIYRCFSSNGSTPTGSCYATPVDVNVVRAAGASYDLTPTISGTPAFIEGGTTDTNKITLSPSVNNSGATASDIAQWRIVTFNISRTGSIPSGGTNGSTPESYFGNGATPVTGGTGTTSFRKNVTNLAVGQQEIGDLPTGTRVCYALSVQPVTQNYAGWRHSTPFCVVVGKSPKVQVYGNDIMVGRLFAGSTVPVPISKVQTSVTTKAVSETTVITPQSAFGGLFNTGVDASAQKLGAGKADPHWVIDRVIRTPGRTGNTCQKGTNALGTGLIAYPTTSASPVIPARTIIENSASTLAGRYTNDDPAVTGIVHPSVSARSGEFVWGRVSMSARWIGQNIYGQNYNETGCYDPTYDTPFDLSNANVYVFKLKDGFTIDPAANVNLDSAKISIGGGVDNQVKFIVNGQELGDWQEPGWGASSSATSSNKANVFQNGTNSLEIWVRSTSWMSGLLIDKLEINATSRQVEANMFGSWAEYGILPTGTVQGMGSASAYANGVATIAPCMTGMLTLANTPDANSCSTASGFGGYRTNKAMPDVKGYFASTAVVQNLTGTTTLSGKNGKYTATSGLTISASTITPGRSVVIYAPNNTVTIQGDITYVTSQLSSIGAIPQVVIIAKDIRITGGVKQLDSWLIASGSVNTCVDVAGMTQLTIDTCTNPLVVNGPVMAGKLLLWRTAGSGSGAAAGDPAEIFNLRPDAYLWGISKAGASGRLTTVYERELPPRF